MDGAPHGLVGRAGAVLPVARQLRRGAAQLRGCAAGGALRLEAEGGEQLTSLLSDEELKADAAGVHRVALPAYGYRWYRVGGFGYALNARRDSGAGEAW